MASQMSSGEALNYGSEEGFVDHFDRAVDHSTKFSIKQQMKDLVKAANKQVTDLVAGLKSLITTAFPVEA